MNTVQDISAPGSANRTLEGDAETLPITNRHTCILMGLIWESRLKTYFGSICKSKERKVTTHWHRWQESCNIHLGYSAKWQLKSGVKIKLLVGLILFNKYENQIRFEFRGIVCWIEENYASSSDCLPFKLTHINGSTGMTVSYLVTSGFWPRHNRMAWALMSRPQQGRQNNSRMRMPRCRITPTRSRFLPPNVCTVNIIEISSWKSRVNTNIYHCITSSYEKDLQHLRHQCITC